MNILFAGNESCVTTRDWLPFLEESFPDYNFKVFDTAADIVYCNNMQNPLLRNLLKIHFYILMFIKLLLTIRKYKIDIIHFNGAYFFILNFIYLFFNGKIITSPQGSEVNEQCYGHQKFFVQHLLHNSNIITARSEFMRFILTDRLLCKSDKICIFTFGIKDMFFSNEIKCSNVNKPSLLSMRATGKIYNIDKIFQAIGELKQDGHDVNFTYVEYNKEDDIALDMSICDAVHKNLTLEEIALLLSKNDAMISVPSFDGFAVSIMEALAIGTLPVISDIESYNGEFLDSKIVVKTKIDDYLDLKNTLLNVINDIQAIRQNVNLRKEYAKEHYSRDAQKKIIEKIYLSLQAN